MVKKILGRILLASVIFAGVSASAQAQDCGMRDKDFWGLEYAVQNTDSYDAKLKLVESVLKKTAISTSQAIELIGLFDNKRDEVAIKIYHTVCDSANWANVYSIPELSKKRDKIEREILKTKARDEGYNRKHHADWYNTGDGWNHANWGNAQAHAHNSAPAADAAILAELARQREESAALRAELDRLKDEKNRVACEREKAAAYKRGYDEGYRRGYGDSQYDTANSCQVMSDGAFNSLISQLKKTIDPSGKEKIVKSAASGNNFTCAQVKRIIKEMSFKSSEEDAAVVLYPHICDRENWFGVYDAFSFPFSVDEVNKRLGI